MSHESNNGPSPETGEVFVTGPGWDAALGRVAGRTTMLVGQAGTGKSRLARYLAEQTRPEAGPVALVTADMGQPMMGVPTCLAASLGPRWDEPAALWFIGDVTPRGNLLQAVVGTARLVQRMRHRGAATILIDTSGWTDGAAARILKYHKLLASGAGQVIALQFGDELEPLLRVLEGIGPPIVRMAPVDLARDRSTAQRTAFRETCYRNYFRTAARRSFSRERLIDADWQRPGAVPAAGTVVGLLDAEGFCLGLGVAEAGGQDSLDVLTPWDDVGAVQRLQQGRLRLDPQADWVERPAQAQNG